MKVHSQSSGPFGHDKYYNPIYVGGNGTENIPAVIFSTGSDENII